jgi:hypothetical protein
LFLADLSNATFVPVGPPHGVPGDHPSYGSDFPGSPFDASGRVLYSGDSYRTADSDMYNPAPSPDFASTVKISQTMLFMILKYFLLFFS